MASTLGSMLSTLQQIDFFQIALPFLFTFAVVYGILEKIDLFGDADRVHAIVAAVAGLFAARFVLITGVDLPVLMSNYLGALAILFMFIMAAMLVRGLVGAPGEGYRRIFMWLGAIAAVLLFVAWGGLQVMLPSTQPFTQTWFFSSTTFITLVVVLVAIAAIAYIGGFVGGGGGEEAEEPE